MEASLARWLASRHLSMLDIPLVKFIRPALLSSDFDTTLVANDTTVFTLEDESQIPMVNYDLQTPSKRVLCDLVDADIKYKATIPIWDWGQPEPKVQHHTAKGGHVDEAVSLVGRIERLDDSNRSNVVIGE